MTFSEDSVAINLRKELFKCVCSLLYRGSNWNLKKVACVLQEEEVLCGPGLQTCA